MADTYWDHPSRREVKRLIDLGDAGAILDELQQGSTEWDDAREALGNLVRAADLRAAASEDTWRRWAEARGNDAKTEVERLRAELAEATGTAFRCANCGLWHHDDEPAEQDVRCDECGHAQPRDEAEFLPAYTAVKAERDAFRLEAADAATNRDAAEARIEELEDGWDRDAKRLRAELATVRDKKALARALSERQGFAQRETARADNAEAERDAARNELAAAHDELMRTRLMLSDARDERDAALDGTEGGQ